MQKLGQYDLVYWDCRSSCLYSCPASWAKQTACSIHGHIFSEMLSNLAEMATSCDIYRSFVMSRSNFALIILKPIYGYMVQQNFLHLGVHFYVRYFKDGW